MIDQFLKNLFLIKIYTPELIILYVIAGILAGLTRLTIKNNAKIEFKKWWDDGSLSGAILIGITGALLFDNNFLWAFLGGYFIVYVLRYIQKGLDKVNKKEVK